MSRAIKGRKVQTQTEDDAMQISTINADWLRQALLDARVPSEATMYVFGKLPEIAKAYNVYADAAQEAEVQQIGEEGEPTP